MTIEQLIAQIRAGMAARLAERDTQRQIIETVRGECVADGQTVDPTEAQAQRVRAAQTEIARLDTVVETQTARIVELEAEQARDNAATDLQRQLVPSGVQAGGAPDSAQRADRNVGGARVVREDRTYTQRKDASAEARFFQDAWNWHRRGDVASIERIERHAAEVLAEGEMSVRATSTGSFAGLIVPQYLTDLAAPILRAGRPTANACNRHQIPDKGMALIIPRGTTGASAAAQATENTQVSVTDEVWANLTVPVCTVAGEQDVSRQAIERGEGTDVIVFQDLARAYAAQEDNYIWNGTGASGQPLGLLNTSGIAAASAFGAAPSAANQQTKVAGAWTAVSSAGSGLFPKFLFMHPRRWGWYTGLSDPNGRPVVTANQMGAYNAQGIITAPGKIGADEDPITGLTVVGIHASGLPVITDLAIPTTVGTNSEDLMVVGDTQEWHLWEDGDGMPKQLNFEQTQGNKLTVTLVVYNYMAFTSGRYPAATAKVGGLDVTAGNGLIAPTF